MKAECSRAQAQVGFSAALVVLTVAAMALSVGFSDQAFSALLPLQSGSGEGSGGASIPQLVPPGFEAYKNTPKSLYVWSATTLKKAEGGEAWNTLIQNRNGQIRYLADFCELHGIDRVYLFVGSVEWEWEEYFGKGVLPYQDDLERSVRLLNDRGIAVDFLIYVNDDPNSLAGWERVPVIAEMVRKFKNTRSLDIRSLQVDQEPGDASVYKDFVRMLLDSASAFPMSVAIKPAWLRQSLESISSQFSLIDLSLDYPQLQGILSSATHFADVVNYICQSTTMMAYSNSEASVVSLADQYMASLERVQAASGENAIETGFVNNLPAAETLHYEILADKEGWFDVFSRLASSFQTSAGSHSVSQRVVIHDYAQYFNTLYCEDPTGKLGVGIAAYRRCE